jgi:hypothetical protein
MSLRLSTFQRSLRAADAATRSEAATIFDRALPNQLEHRTRAAVDIFSVRYQGQGAQMI